jgi:hypothetical protein
MSISNKKLNFWAENNYNVIFCGRHGVGKTAIIESVFNEHFGQQGKDWLYFSAATMDPWVDFIGVPKEKKDDDGTSYLELVRPKVFALDQVKAIFFDEFNRSPKKVRNAVMELMQFKSINGHKFENLRIIWGAINPPENDEDDFVYDVEQIDPAQLDRFHIYVDLPYTVSKVFFKKKYGDVEGTAACDWWDTLSQAQKDVISPRRLDYAVGCWAAGGDIKDVLPVGISTSELQRQLKSGSYKKRLSDLLSNEDITNDTLSEELKDERFFSAVQDRIMKDQTIFNRLFPLFEDEKMVKTISEFTPKTIKERLAGIGENENMFRVLSEACRTKRSFLTAAKRREITRWQNIYHKDEMDTDVENDHEAALYDILKENTCSDADARTIETENTYYRNKRMESIHDFLNNNRHFNAIETLAVSLSAQWDLFDALSQMCHRYNIDTLKSVKTTYFRKGRNSYKRLHRLVNNLENSDEYAYLTESEIVSNEKLAVLLN